MKVKSIKAEEVIRAGRDLEPILVTELIRPNAKRSVRRVYIPQDLVETSKEIEFTCEELPLNSLAVWGRWKTDPDDDDGNNSVLYTSDSLLDSDITVTFSTVIRVLKNRGRKVKNG